MHLAVTACIKNRLPTAQHLVDFDIGFWLQDVGRCVVVEVQKEMKQYGSIFIISLLLEQMRDQRARESEREIRGRAREHFGSYYTVTTNFEKSL